MANSDFDRIGDALTREQIDTANRAAYEQQLLAKALQTYIEAEDEHDTIGAVAKVMLARITDLADAIGWALEPQQFSDAGVDGLKRAVRFVAGDQAEVTHG
jgi:hypothetical protein